MGRLRGASRDGVSIAAVAKWLAGKGFRFCATHWRKASPDPTEGERWHGKAAAVEPDALVMADGDCAVGASSPAV
ncbi:MAG TPA: hypothetical protein VEF72_01560 [Mycobacterium sp.]|nr:hypothetical protein [Mycobacterium sp.]